MHNQHKFSSRPGSSSWYTRTRQSRAEELLITWPRPRTELNGTGWRIVYHRVDHVVWDIIENSDSLHSCIQTGGNHTQWAHTITEKIPKQCRNVGAEPITPDVGMFLGSNDFKNVQKLSNALQMIVSEKYSKNRWSRASVTAIKLNIFLQQHITTCWIPPIPQKLGNYKKNIFLIKEWHIILFLIYS